MKLTTDMVPEEQWVERIRELRMREMLVQTGGKQREAARLLGMNYSTFYTALTRFNRRLDAETDRVRPDLGGNNGTDQD